MLAARTAPVPRDGGGASGRSVGRRGGRRLQQRRRRRRRLPRADDTIAMTSGPRPGSADMERGCSPAQQRGSTSLERGTGADEFLVQAKGVN